jgi:hypothetical protein
MRNTALSFPGPIPPRNLNSGAGEEEVWGERNWRYTAAAVFGGRDIPGRRKTTICEYARLGRTYSTEVEEGEELGVIMGGWPVGIMPKSWGRGWGCEDIV